MRQTETQIPVIIYNKTKTKYLTRSRNVIGCLAAKLFSEDYMQTKLHYRNANKNCIIWLFKD